MPDTDDAFPAGTLAAGDWVLAVDTDLQEGSEKRILATELASAPAAHASDHTDGTDDIQDATNAQKGLATAAQITTLESAMQGLVDDASPELAAALDANGWDVINVGQFCMAAWSEVTISSGAVTVGQSVHSIDTESDAASDDLDTITAPTGSALLYLRAESAARTVVIKNGTGNITTTTAADITLDDGAKMAFMVWDNGLSVWLAAPLFATSGGGDMLAANNLSELAAASTARDNLGLGDSDSPDFAGVLLAGNAAGTAGGLALHSSTLVLVPGFPTATADSGNAGEVAISADKMAWYVAGTGWVFSATGHQI